VLSPPREPPNSGGKWLARWQVTRGLLPRLVEHGRGPQHPSGGPVALLAEYLDEADVGPGPPQRVLGEPLDLASGDDLHPGHRAGPEEVDEERRFVLPGPPVGRPELLVPTTPSGP